MLYANLFIQTVIEIILFSWFLENTAHGVMYNTVPRLNINRNACVILTALYLLNFERFMFFIEYPTQVSWLWDAIYVIQLYVPIVLVIVIGRLLGTVKQLTVNRHEYENWKQLAVHLLEIIVIIPVIFIEFTMAQDVLNYIVLST